LQHIFYYFAGELQGIFFRSASCFFFSFELARKLLPSKLGSPALNNGRGYGPDRFHYRLTVEEDVDCGK
jgi:hypothetical protein